jgi:hypothetical protein
MNPAYLKKRGDDLPLFGKIIREKPGQYCVLIYFLASRRHYADEEIFARNARQVKAHVAKLYPTLVWKRPVKKAARPKRKRISRAVKKAMIAVIVDYHDANSGE